MKKRGITTLWLLMVALVMMAKSYTVTSPNGQLTAQVEVGTVIKYSLKDAIQQLVLPSAIALKTDRGTWGENSHLRRAVKTTHRGQIAAFAYKRNEVSDCYNQLRLQFKEGFDLIFRLYDEGMAYRFASTLKSEVTINDEQAQMRFARDWKAQIPYVRDSGDREDQLHNSFENNYTHTALSQLMDTRLIFTPLIVEADKGVRLCVAESDVEHYPGLFWLGNGKTPELTGVCAPIPAASRLEATDCSSSCPQVARTISSRPMHSSSSPGASSAMPLPTSSCSTTTWYTASPHPLASPIPHGYAPARWLGTGGTTGEYTR